MADLAERIIAEHDQALAERAPFDPHWQSIAEYTEPEMAEFTQSTSPGQPRGTKIVNSWGVKCSEELALRIDGFLSQIGTPWWDLRIEDRPVEEDPEVRLWLDHLKQVGNMVYTNPASGFEQSKEPMYRQVVAFGNGPMYVGETDTGWPRFYSEFLGRCAAWVDDEGWPTALFRRYERSAWRLIQQFGKDGVPFEVRQALEQDPQKKFWCRHACRPVMEGDPYDFAGRGFLNAYALEETKSLLGQPKFDFEFQWVFPRWRVAPNEPYGRGPGSRALPDVKMLQKIDTDLIKHISFNVNPNWVVPHESGQSPRINQVPGGLIFAEFSPQGQPHIARLGPGGSAQEAEWMQAKIEQRIEYLYYLHAFKLIEKITKDGAVVHMSATEFAGRQADQLRHAGPSIARLRTEFLYPVMSRVFRILARNKKIRPPPDSLRGRPVHPEFVSPLALALSSSDRQAIMGLIGDTLALAEIHPESLDFLDVTRAYQRIAKGRHVPADVLRTPDELAQRRQARADAQTQMRDAEIMQQSASSTLDNAKAVQVLRQVGA